MSVEPIAPMIFVINTTAQIERISQRTGQPANTSVTIGASRNIENSSDRGIFVNAFVPARKIGARSRAPRYFDVDEARAAAAERSLSRENRKAPQVRPLWGNTDAAADIPLPAATVKH